MQQLAVITLSRGFGPVFGGFRGGLMVTDGGRRAAVSDKRVHLKKGGNMRRRRKVFRNDRVHVMAERCATCIFRPGNRMDLRPGCVRQMVAEAQRDEGSIVCHETLDNRRPAVCRGFFDRYPTPLLQIAERLGVIEWQ